MLVVVAVKPTALWAGGVTCAFHFFIRHAHAARRRYSWCSQYQRIGWWWRRRDAPKSRP